jgi:glycosyltransferase involved in cell wall biosynthesis
MKLVVIPSDPIEAYEKKGTSSWLENYYNPNKYFKEVYILSPLEKIRREIYGLKIIPVKSRLHLQKLIKQINPDLIRAYGGYWPADYAIVNKLPVFPVIVSIHDTNPQLINNSIKFADHIICMTKAVQEAAVKKLGITTDITSILGNRVDTKIFKEYKDSKKVQKIRSRFPEGKLILHVGRKSFQKNIETLIRSLKFLPDDNFCVFIGLGEKQSYLELAESNGVIHRCFWLDSVENSELPFWYNACDLFCVLSRWEGFGLVFIEAAACEAMILTSDISPMNQILDRNSCFFIDKYENPEAVALRISEIFSMDPAIIFNLRKSARASSLKFDITKIAFDEVKIYKDVLGRGIRKLTTKEKLQFRVWKFSHLARVAYKKLKRRVKNVFK